MVLNEAMNVEESVEMNDLANEGAENTFQNCERPCKKHNFIEIEDVPTEDISNNNLKQRADYVDRVLGGDFHLFQIWFRCNIDACH